MEPGRADLAAVIDDDVDGCGADLILERLPSGQFAWLRPEPRYVLTDQGRAAIAEASRR